MVNYLKIIPEYPPYCLLNNRRGYISKLYGNGHTGVDSVGNQWDNPVASLIDGECAKDKNTMLGNIVTITNGPVQVLYYHLKEVTAPDYVKAGQQVGIEGSTGTLAQGKHLHTSIRINGQLVDPLPYLSGEANLQDIINNGPDGAETEEKYMIRKVIKALNLRSSRSLTANNYVYRDMPVGTIFLVTDKVTESGITWGKVYTNIGGKSYAGWSNIAETWSREV